MSEAPRQHCMLLTYEKPGGDPKSFYERRLPASARCRVQSAALSREAGFAVESSVPGSPEVAGSDGA